MKRFGYPKYFRLKSRKEIYQVFQKGKRINGKYYTIICCPNGLEYSRLAVSINKKFGKANKRNYEKRQVKELFRHYCMDFMPHDFIVIIRRHEQDAFAKRLELLQLWLKFRKKE